MTRFRPFLSRHRGCGLLLAIGIDLFLLWFGLWLRVLPDRPRVSIKVPEHTEVVGVSNDGRWVVTRGRPPLEPTPPGYLVDQFSSPTGPIRVWDMKSVAVVADFLGPEDDVTLVFVSPDGRFAAVSQEQKRQMRVFDFLSGRELGISPLPFAGTHFCFSPDGRLFADVQMHRTRSPTIFVSDLAEERERFQLVGQNGPFAFSPDSSRLASTTFQNLLTGEAVLWDIESGTEMRRFETKHQIRDLVFSPDGSRLAVTTQPRVNHRDLAPRDVIVYDLGSGQALEHHENADWFTFLPNGTLLVRPGNTVRGVASNFDHFHPSPRGRFLVFHHFGTGKQGDWFERFKKGRWGPADDDAEDYVDLRDLATGKLVARIEGCSFFRLSDDETVAACMGPGGEIQVWDLPPRRPVLLLLVLAAAPALMFTAAIWWRLGRT